ncbi:MAG: ADP compounds hydrolase NudE [Thiopseudomonas sp.]|nr:ADP compounds hydrolase NudE [Thiopseudomonas sp.]MCK9466587.1 ADP compounds hydrolase NudE [Thiopseudomonas sp.]
MRVKPEILSCEQIAQTRIFRVEQMQLRFSNGEERTYERLRGRADGHGAVMIVALDERNNAVLIEEYCAGSARYEWSLPKGLIDAGEDALQAANRELQEEAGFAAKELEVLAELSLSPGYMSQRVTVVLARDIYPSSLPGDEPEPMRVRTHPLSDLLALLREPNFSEGRALGALYIARDVLMERGQW